MFLIDVLIHGLGWASIYALIAVGFTLIFNASKVINLAQGDFVMLGGLLAFSLYSWGIPLPLIPLLAALGVALVGAGLERVAISPASKASPTSLIIITIALSIILKSTAALIWGPHHFRIPEFFQQSSLSVGGVIVETQYLLVMTVCLVCMVVLTLFLRKTKLGRSIRASSMDPVGARIVGVSPGRMRLLSFFISAGLGGMVGTIIAPIFYASADCGLNLGLKGFCAAVLGGMGSIPGALVGGVIIGLSEALSVSVISAYKDVIAPVLMIVILYLQPRGILGRRS